MRLLQRSPGQPTPTPNIPGRTTPNNQPRGPDKADIHSKMMIIVWLAAGNIGLWSQAFKHYSWANHVHYYSMLIVTIITWMSGFMAVMEFGFPSKAGLQHDVIGLIIMILLIVQVISGMVCWFLQKSATAKATFIPIFNIGHQIIGWISFILTMV